MDDWHYGSWLQEMYMTGKLTTLAIIVGAIALISSIIYFIDGIKKYGYWLHKNDDKEDK
jgi:hypothetical protein